MKPVLHLALIAFVIIPVMIYIGAPKKEGFMDLQQGVTIFAGSIITLGAAAMLYLFFISATGQALKPY